jgi:solute carrier family 25 (adenine nucleotide translocator) protein 4/5/6/31
VGQSFDFSVNHLYSGFFVSVAGIFLYRLAYFGLYDFFKDRIHSTNFVAQFTLGYAVTVTAGVLVYPVDTIRRFQMVNAARGVPSGAMEVTRMIYSQFGIPGFFHGVGYNLLRGVVGAMALLLFDGYKSWLLNVEQIEEKND